MQSKVSPYLLIFISLVIMLVASYLRLTDLSTNPSGFFADEASIGFNAYTILTKGTDEYGIKLPMFFKAFGEYKGPVEVYLTVPFVYLFGVNVFAVRVANVFYSLCTLPILFFVGRIMKDKYLGLFLMGIFAISPWSIHLSRVNLSLMSTMILFFTVTLLFYLRYWRDRKPFDLYAFSFFAAITTYCYFPIRIIMAGMMCIYIGALIYKRILRKELFYALLLFAILMYPLIYHSFWGDGMSRWNQVSVFSEGISITDTISQVGYNYLMHFSYDFLFAKGDAGMMYQVINRHSLLGIGELFSWQTILIPFGLYALYKDKKRLLLLILVGLLVLYPLPSSLTSASSPQATRALIGVIPFTILSGIGLSKLLEFFQYKNLIESVIVVSSLILIFFSSVTTVFMLLKQYPLRAYDYWSWQAGFQQIVEVMKENETNFVSLRITNHFNGPEELLEFFNITEQCSKCMIAENPITAEPRPYDLYALRIDEVENYKNTKYAFIRRSIVYYPNGEPGFWVGYFTKVS